MLDLLTGGAPNGLFHLIVLTVLLGGAGAMASGRAVARQWKSFAIVPLYMLVLSAVLRFLHYALFQEDILSIAGFIVALVVTLAAAGYGYRSQRTRQMVTQYSWIYQAAGPLGWVARAP